MDRARRILIEELLRVGRLIDPAPGTGEHEFGSPADPLDTASASTIEKPAKNTNLDDLPVLENVVNQPYDNIDMFATSTKTLSVNPNDHPNQVVLPTREPYKSRGPSVNPEMPAVTELEIPFTKEVSEDPVAAEELARELVDLIENLVNQRTGEQLADPIRDDLMQAIINHIKGWLKSD